MGQYRHDFAQYQPIVLLRLVFTLLLIAVGQVDAQSSNAKPANALTSGQSVAIGSEPVVSGLTFDKKPFQLASLKGKVVVLMFWTTDCAVCRDQMPELRENIRGWADKPFELVLVSADKRMSDVDSYNAIVSQSVPVKQRFVQLWTGDGNYKSSVNVGLIPKNQLPLTYVLDKNGKVVAGQNGRIPAAWWDFIADLL
ncbi:MAG TPA: TlpA disulfide reductase family protein [Burkholderiaceae bacterium]|nr:TlpA disulfide reductase family protein [Burkholderiaceae bacterium]